ncbi:MAG: DUF4272 domain-containing protein [Pyrinomonadaceae bacterium]
MLRFMLIASLAMTLSLGGSCATTQPMNSSSVTASSRKKRSEQYLKSLGIPINPYLPLVEDESEARLRKPQQVAERAIILHALVMVAHRADRESVASWLKKEELWESLSPSKKAFLRNHNPPEQAVIEASWRAESLWALLWALGKVEKLELPKELCDSEVVQQIMPDLGAPTGQFINQAMLRLPDEILDATDLIYRINWAVVDARLNERETPGEFHPGIVYERHYALNWLTWYADEWDDITTDT